MISKHNINKTKCIRLAAEVRSEIGLEPMDALDPWKLAQLYGIMVIPLSTLPLSSVIRNYFSITRQEVFSGALVPFRHGTVIIENDSHSNARRRSTMSHELAHVFGEHSFGTSLANGRGCRMVDQVQEEEAAEISGELLIPFEAAKKLARNDTTDEEVALRFGVSTDMARWRLNATGARRIAAHQNITYRRSHRA